MYWGRPFFLSHDKATDLQESIPAVILATTFSAKPGWSLGRQGTRVTESPKPVHRLEEHKTPEADSTCFGRLCPHGESSPFRETSHQRCSTSSTSAKQVVSFVPIQSRRASYKTRCTDRADGRSRDRASEFGPGSQIWNRPKLQDVLIWTSDRCSAWSHAIHDGGGGSSDRCIRRPLTFTLQATEHIANECTNQMVRLIVSSAAVAGSSEIVSIHDVSRATRATADTSSRLNQLLGTMAGVIAGAGLSGAIGVCTSGHPTVSGVAISFCLTMIGIIGVSISLLRRHGDFNVTIRNRTKEMAIRRL